MGYYNIKVTEYGEYVNVYQEIKKKYKNMDFWEYENNDYYEIKNETILYPEHYTWEYCLEKKIPWIVIMSFDNSYLEIHYNLNPIDPNLSFIENQICADNIQLMYITKYVQKYKLPKSKISRSTSDLGGHILIKKNDKNKVISLLLNVIERCVNEYGIFDPASKKGFDENEEHNAKQSANSSQSYKDLHSMIKERILNELIKLDPNWHKKQKAKFKKVK